MEKLLAFSIEDLGDPREKCKGIFFRASASEYLSSHRSIESRKSLRVLKTKSCQGCSDCEWMWESISEDMYCVDGMLSNVEHGKMYKYTVFGGHDFESGHYEVDGSEFTEVKERT